MMVVKQFCEKLWDMQMEKCL